MSIRTLNRSFSGGEVTPELYGRIDDPKYQSGCSTMRNFIALPHGPASNRPGFEFVREVKTSSAQVRLIPFSYSTTQTMVIELGAGYFRFHTAGATLLSGGVPYEVANTYAEADLFSIHYVQSNDVLTLVHPNYPPKELKRLGATSWTLTTISFVSSMTPPTGVTATPAGGAATYSYSYVVTSVGVGGVDESVVSSAATCSNNLYTTGARNTIAWSAASGAQSYRVYKQVSGGGNHGYIGQTTTLNFVDENIAENLAKTPPIANNPFSGTGNYPGAVSYFEQRRCFAGTTNLTQTMWMTRTGTESSMDYSVPIRDDDSISFKIAAREANTIRHIVPLNSIILLTSAAEWRAGTPGGEAVTPASITVKPQSYVGSGNAVPIVVNNNLIYAAARGGHVRELGYSQQAGGYITGDLSLRAPHLFDGLTVVDMAYAKSPQPICWFVSSNGKLIGLTYVPEQQLYAWHQHDTDGLFESVCVVSENNEDVLYSIVRRTIGGVTKRYVERLHSRIFSDQADAFFVDSGLAYSGTPVTTLSGLSHLEGKTVNILADGAVHPQRVVTAGAVTLDMAASKVVIGLPIQADIQTLPVAQQVDGGFGQGRIKNVNKAWLRVYRSSGIFIGPELDKLVEVKQRTSEAYGAAPALKTDEIEVMLNPSWGSGGQIYIRQNAPLPLTLVALTLEVSLGN